MQKIRDFLLGTLGTLGMLLFYVIALLITSYPLFMFDMPWLLFIVLALIAQFVIIYIPFGLEVMWIIGLFGALSGKQDVFAVIYYILFVLIVGHAIINLFRIFFSKNR
jgi:hypothetical protein